MRFFLRKQNRLSREKDINLLFGGSKSIFVYPVKMVYSLTEISPDGSRFKVMVVASKRSFKRAVKRNFIKRKLREVFRLNVYKLVDSIPPGKRVDIALIFISKNFDETALIEKSTIELLARLKSKINT